MTPNNAESAVFIVVSLFLLAIIILMLSIQLIIWATIKIKNKHSNILNSSNKSYSILLEKEQYDGTVEKTKWVPKFKNYDKKNNCLKLKTNDFEEKNVWNHYQNLISVLVVRWKKSYKRTSFMLIISTLIFYLDTIMIVVCALVYYINYDKGALSTSDTTLLGILSFVAMIILVLSWLLWTMTYEKVRKEIIELSESLENKELTKAVKKISGFKTLFPGSELLF